jgi:uncharacterized protein (TIGR03067 family)
LTAAAGLLLIGLQSPAGQPAARTGLPKLEGAWQAVSYALDGKTAPAEDLKKIQLIIDGQGNTKAQIEGKTFIASTIKTDPGKSPRTMDITFTEGPDKGKTSLGIYKVEGDVLTICRAAPGQDRPAAFASRAGSGHTLMSYRRVKPDAK